MSRRISSVKELHPTGTNINAETDSNVVNMKAAGTAIIYVIVATVPGGGASLDIEIQTAPENDDAQFTTVKSLDNPIIATGNFVETLKPEELGAFVRLKSTPSAGTFVLGAKIEKRQES